MTTTTRYPVTRIPFHPSSTNNASSDLQSFKKLYAYACSPQSFLSYSIDKIPRRNSFSENKNGIIGIILQEFANWLNLLHNIFKFHFREIELYSKHIRSPLSLFEFLTSLEYLPTEMKRRWCTITRKKFHDGNNIEAKIYITRIACNSRTAFQTFEIFSTHFRRGIFTFHEGGGGDRGIALHGVKRYPQRRFRYVYIYIYMYQACYNLGMRGGKDEFAIHVPRGVFGAGFESQIPRKVVSPSPGFVEGRPLIWKLHATSPRNAFKFDHSIY